MKKIIKKTLTLTLLFALAILLFSCGIFGENGNNEKKPNLDENKETPKSENVIKLENDWTALDFEKEAVEGEGDSLNLPKKGKSGSSITWKSGNTDALSDDGIARVLPEKDIHVTLTATLTLNGESIKREFNVTVQSKRIKVNLCTIKLVGYKAVPEIIKTEKYLPGTVIKDSRYLIKVEKVKNPEYYTFLYWHLEGQEETPIENFTLTEDINLFPKYRDDTKHLLLSSKRRFNDSFAYSYNFSLEIKEGETKITDGFWDGNVYYNKGAVISFLKDEIRSGDLYGDKRHIRFIQSEFPNSLTEAVFNYDKTENTSTFSKKYINSQSGDYDFSGLEETLKSFSWETIDGAKAISKEPLVHELILKRDIASVVKALNSLNITELNIFTEDISVVSFDKIKITTTYVEGKELLQTFNYELKLSSQGKTLNLSFDLNFKEQATIPEDILTLINPYLQQKIN